MKYWTIDNRKSEKCCLIRIPTQWPHLARLPYVDNNVIRLQKSCCQSLDRPLILFLSLLNRFALKANSILGIWILSFFCQLCWESLKQWVEFQPINQSINQSVKADYYWFQNLIWLSYVSVFSDINFNIRKLTSHIILFFLSFLSYFSSNLYLTAK